MFETASKNLWILLTLIIPGFCTYGIWRLLILLEPDAGVSAKDLYKIDESAIVTSSIIIGVALSQQAFAIVLEAVLTILARLKRESWPNFYSLFCERFELTARAKLNEGAKRTVGNFFLSVNMGFGTMLLLFYFILYKGLSVFHWISISLTILFITVVIASAFRMQNAKWVIVECKKP